MTAPLLSEAQVEALVMQCAVVADCDEEWEAIRQAIRQAVKLAGEEAAKLLDKRVAFMSAHCNQDGHNNGPDMFMDEIEALTEGAAAIRARLG